MITAKEPSQLLELPDGNRFFGNVKMQNSTVVFSGKNNILYCDGDVVLNGAYLNFAGDGAVIYLCGGRPYKMSVEIYNDSIFYMGRDNFINGYRQNVFKLSEQKHIFIGNDCLLSFDLSFRTADPHLIYDAQTGKRLNYSKSIYVGDHVWIGQSALLLKGTQIHSGCIVGSMALLSNKKLPHQTSWGGNPAKQLRENVFWKRDCVHTWKQAETSKSAQLEPGEPSILNHDPSHYISFDELDQSLSSAKSAEERCEILKKVSANTSPCRFVEPPLPRAETEKKSSFLARLFSKTP